MASNFKISELQALSRTPVDNDRFIINDAQNTTSQNTRYINYSDLKDSITSDIDTSSAPGIGPVTMINWNGSRSRKGSSVTWPSGTVADTQWDPDATKTRRTATPLVYRPPAYCDRMAIIMHGTYFIDVTSTSALTVQFRNRLLMEANGLQGMPGFGTVATHPGWTNNNTNGKISIQLRFDDQMYDVPKRQLSGSNMKFGMCKFPKGTASINLYNALSVVDTPVSSADSINCSLLKVALIPFDSAQTDHPEGLFTSFGAFFGAENYVGDEDNEDDNLFTDQDIADALSDSIKRRMKKDLDLITQFEDEFPTLTPYRQQILDFRADGSNYTAEVAHNVYMSTISEPIYNIIKFTWTWAPSQRGEF